MAANDIKIFLNIEHKGWQSIESNCKTIVKYEKIKPLHK